MALLVRTPELWSINARALLSSKNIDPVMLQSQIHKYLLSLGFQL